MNFLKLIFLFFPVFFFTQVSYEGKIGNYPIELVLNIDGKFADGIYIYSKFNEPISIKGIIENGHLILFELDGDTRKAKFYFNNFKDGKEEYLGTWTNLKTEVQLNVYLKKKANQKSFLQSESTKQFYFRGTEENEENYLLIIDKKSNQIFQKMKMEECSFDGIYDVSVGDYNFDGYEDFSSCVQSYAGPNTSKTYFLFDNKKNEFFASDFSGTSLEFDEKNKLITETNQCCAGASIVKNIYKVKENKMVLVKEHCYKWSEKLQKHIEKKPKDCQ
ncbi:XAC2610-related protein [Epilithonimonas zeae]|uniref:Uncharacterized protein n=1 Tax=Epilithonimonas zeae TaxID=1416779 RepID=A0A1N6IM87_9FLAO|nr:hypothetical protein [Epilithonimonas zeae]SIO33142.1 hypothetical protein SAMN05444409_2803 [Epilithonimonas zeae]